MSPVKYVTYLSDSTASRADQEKDGKLLKTHAFDRFLAPYPALAHLIEYFRNRERHYGITGCSRDNDFFVNGIENHPGILGCTP